MDSFRKARVLQNEATCMVSLRAAVDISTSPYHPRVAFPGDKTPACTELERPINVRSNVSASPLGPCWVSGPVHLVFHSHAGSHADSPGHWLDDPPFAAFDDRCYTGDAWVLDLTKRHGVSILPEDLDAAAQGLSLKKARRLLLRTYAATPAVWDADFSFLQHNTAELLANLPELVLVGIDTPSVDAPDMAPIGLGAHGLLGRGQVAILEGLEFGALPLGPPTVGVIETRWNPLQCFDDAKGALVNFYPAQELANDAL